MICLELKRKKISITIWIWADASYLPRNVTFKSTWNHSDCTDRSFHRNKYVATLYAAASIGRLDIG